MFWKKTKKITYPALEDTRKTAEEWGQFIKLVNRQVHTGLKDQGHDLATLDYSVVQPFDSKHYFIVTVNTTNKRNLSVDIGENVSNIDRSLPLILTLSEKEGFLDIFHPDTTKKAKQKILETIQTKMDSAQELADKRKEQSR